jgi:glycosyltransferase involved in cell wall biosynthesis
MRVLMVSPHPVYSPRGTPISVFNRCVALSALGHEIDLVTYPVGEDRATPGLRYLRSKVPGVRSVAVGPSFTKLVLNAAVTVRSFKEAARGRRRYDVVHTHEEAGLFGPALARIAGTPHIYDMGNDWSDVLCNYGLSARHPANRLAGSLESAVIRHSDAVIAHFPLIAERVESMGTTPVQTVFNIPLEAEPDPAVASLIRNTWAPDGAKVILYTGTLEPYQGIPLLLESMAAVARAHPAAVLIVMGGRPEQIDKLELLAAELRVSDRVRFAGAVPSTLVPACLEAADILVSPRERGRNTPLKIFSYLRSGRPIVATEIDSHTQVLDHRSCVLVSPTAEGLSSGISALLEDGLSRARAVEGARTLRREFGIEQYVSSVATAYHHVGGEPADECLIAHASARIREATAGSVPDIADQGFFDEISFVPRRVAV